jgi:hypothetical protein
VPKHERAETLSLGDAYSAAHRAMEKSIKETSESQSSPAISGLVGLHLFLGEYQNRVIENVSFKKWINIHRLDTIETRRLPLNRQYTTHQHLILDLWDTLHVSKEWHADRFAFVGQVTLGNGLAFGH